MLAAMRRMEMVTNNIANAQTAGYKQDRSALSTFTEVMILQDGTPLAMPQDANIGQLGTAAVTEEPTIDFTQGMLQETERSLDFALEGPGFFAIQTQDGIRYTRDGTFTRDALGRLTNTEGELVLGADGNPITIPAGKLQVQKDGVMTADDEPFAQLMIVEFTLDQPLKKVGNNQFVARNENDQPRPSASTAVHQGSIEVSNLDMAGAQTTMLELQRAYQASQRLIQYQDEMVGRAVNDIARPVS
jgi:flagellar basal-body rod protein FlgG